MRFLEILSLLWKVFYENFLYHNNNNSQNLLYLIVDELEYLKNQ